ncbi:MAG: exopolyphosphatase [Limosilactobacillus gorillae]|uniref:exopolyphosphatase n=1 Tax=Limosilactobacillus gorillae TaxID=1450649 RepID=UPI000B891C86|nr:exopolyphosphatase [Limosilactobacillus gorillae]MDO4855563.1 exopolyphosphatase [Limosilactobacillus gorillae]
MVYVAKQRYGGIIFLEPDQVGLQIIDRQEKQVVTTVRSGNLNVGSEMVANYAENMDAIVDNLLGFQRVLTEYQVDEVKFYGALEDLDEVTARYVADQLSVRCGLEISWLSDNQLIAKILVAIKDQHKLVGITEGFNTFVLLVGLSTSTLAYFKKGVFETSWNIDLGKAKISQLADNLRQTTATPSDIIFDYISSKVEYLVGELGEIKGANLIVQGVSVLADTYLTKEQPLGEVSLSDFDTSYRQIIDSTNQYVINHYRVDEQSVSWVLPGFLIISQILRLLHAKQLYVTKITSFESLIRVHDEKKVQIDQMIRTSADNIAKRYGVKLAHRSFVTKVTLELFDALAPIHRLDEHYRLLVEIASKVDDIGNFISPQGHYRHSAYILEANPLIGLSDQDNRVIAEVSRYHSSESPDVDEHHYRNMDNEIQLPVAKLAAILRVADSLDDSRQQKISKLELKLEGDRLKIYAHASDDLVLEKWAFQRKNKLFTDVYGLQPELIARGEN